MNTGDNYRWYRAVLLIPPPTWRWQQKRRSDAKLNPQVCVKWV